MVATGLRQVAPGHDAEPGAERLQQNRHHVRQHDDAEQRVAKLRAAREVRRPIAGIHVTDRDEIARTGKSQHFAPETEMLRHRDGAMDFLQAGRGIGRMPARLGLPRLGDIAGRQRNWPMVFQLMAL